MHSIKDIVLKENISVKLSDTFAYALEVMAKNKQGVVVVVSKELPVGVITERDVLHIINTNVDFDTTIEFIMKFNHLVTINVKRSIEYALHVLIDNKIRRLIVVDDKDSLLGIVTQDTLVQHLEDDSFKTNLLISSFIQKSKPLICLDKDAKAKEAFELMCEKNIGSIIVTDGEEPIGILTERDGINIINNDVDLNLPISNVLSSPLITAFQNDRVKDVVSLMDKNNINKVLILNHETKKPLYLIGSRDIAHNLKGSYGQILESKLKNVKNTLNYIGESVLEIYEDNREQVIQWMNETALKNFGNLIDRNLLSLIDSKTWETIYLNIRKGAGCNKFKIKINDMYFEMMCSYHYTHKKEALLLILRDITEFEYAVIDAHKNNEKTLQELKILQGVIDQQKSIVLVTNGFGVISANQSLYSFFNVKDLDEFINNFKDISQTFIHHKNFFSLDCVENNWIEDILKIDSKDRIVSMLDLNTFEPKAFTVQVNPLSSDDKNYVVTLTDITEIKLESQQYYFHATHDALTCIYNRSYYFEKISNEIEQAKRYGTTFCIVLFDIDHFKKFNDTYGHLKGDEVLVKLSSTIKSHVRSADTFARWGGEEFIVLLEKTTLDKAELVAEHFRKQIENMKIPGIGKVTSSFGVTQFLEEDDDNKILKRADEALYLAKESGRNCVKVL
jgi:diguanylate cyclase (GGDEF)-like protein